MKINIFEKRFAKRLKDNKNRSVIELCIKNEIDFYNDYSYLNNSINKNIKINNNIIHYLINETENIPLKNSLLICIRTLNTISQNSGFFEKLVKKNIHKKISTINKRIKKINIHSIVLALIGMLLIGMTQISNFVSKQFSLNEFIIVMSWVFMWKAVDLMFFEKTRILKKKRTLMKIYFSQITSENVL